MQENKDPIKEAVGGLAKKKKWLFILPVFPAALLLLILAGVAFVIVYPVIKGGQMISGVSGFWDRLKNTITFKCAFCSDEELERSKEKKFYDKLDKLNQTYLNGKNLEGNGIQLDIPLLLSTIFYSDNVDNTLNDVDLDGKNPDEESNSNSMEEAIEGDIFGDLSWYADESDQEGIEWFKGKTEKEGCYIIGYYYAPPYTPFMASRLRQLAKHMVVRLRNGSCVAKHDEEGNFLGWEIREWYEYKLSVERPDRDYTMEYDIEPYKSYRTKEEVDKYTTSNYVTYLLAKYLPEYYDKELLQSIKLPEAIKDLSDKHKLYLNKRKSMKNVMYAYREGYEYLVGNKFATGTVCGVANGNCTYSVKDKSGKEVDVSNVKVQLLTCGNNSSTAKPIPGQGLIDFEQYIAGVLLSELGGAKDSQYEALKAQAVAARSYALTRGKQMGVDWLQMYEENGQWIIPMRNCSLDQAYCDPDKGCSADVQPGFTSAWSNATLYPGTSHAYTYKTAIDGDSFIRKAVAETTGQVLIDQATGEIKVTPFTNVTQNSWLEAADNGSDYYEALASTYGTNTQLSSSCTGTSGTTINTGNEKYYNQYDYTTVPYCSEGNTIATSGCLPTTFAMAVENITGRVTTPSEVAEYICNDTNGSRKYRVEGSGTSSGFLADPSTQSYFGVATRRLSSSEQNMEKITEILKSGKKLIVAVRTNGANAGPFATNSGHYIILSYMTPDNKIRVLDPGHRNATGDYTTAEIQQYVINQINNSSVWEISGTVTSNVASNLATSIGCYTGATGDYMDWKQGDNAWGDISLGSGGATIESAGCLATSVAKLIAMSGTSVTSQLTDFNPGTMIQYLNKNGGFSGSNWIWGSPQSSGLAPNFVHKGAVTLKGLSNSQKIQTVKQYLDQGYYLVLQVKCNGTEEPGQHWVAVLGVTNDQIIMSDPASDTSNVWDRYKSGGTVQFHYYEKTD